jgi:hypothetical protein
MGSKFYLCVGMGTRTEKDVFGGKKKKKVTRIEVNQRFNWRLTTSKF